MMNSTVSLFGSIVSAAASGSKESNLIEPSWSDEITRFQSGDIDFNLQSWSQYLDDNYVCALTIVFKLDKNLYTNNSQFNLAM